MVHAAYARRNQISFAVGNRLITRHLLSGRVAVDYQDVEVVDVGPAPAPIFPAMVTTRPYDVGELTIGNFIVAKDNGVRLVALPIFPNLFFPLTGVTVNNGAGIAEIGDLAGKRVGVPLGFASNPAVWLRGILAHHHGVAADSITWVEGENDSLRGVPYPKPERFAREQMSDLDARLAAGDLDALVVAGGNAALASNVHLLVDDPYPLLQRYHEETGVFPINTMLVMKEESAAEYIPASPMRSARRWTRRRPCTWTRSRTTRSTRGCSRATCVASASSLGRRASTCMAPPCARSWTTSTRRRSSASAGRSKSCSWRKDPD